MLTQAALVDRIREHRPDVGRTPEAAWAATALVLAPDGRGRPTILFIERAERAGDRWSGHMALPGGRRSPEDATLAETARREALEEVGVPLDAPVGRLDDVRGRVHGGAVATFVFTLEAQATVIPDPGEVAGAVWVPVDHLRSAEAATRHPFAGVGLLPALRFEHYVIWGLTHRILHGFFAAAGAPLP